MYGGFSLHQAVLCQLSRDSVRSHRLRAQSHKILTTLLQGPIHRVPATSVWLGYKSEVPVTSSCLNSVTCKSSSQNSGRHLLTFTSLLKAMVKDTDKQSDEKIHRARSRRVLSTGASVPVELGCISLQYVDVFANLEPLWTPYFWDFMEASSRRHEQLLTPLLDWLPSLVDGGRTENSKFLIMAWSFWWPAPTQEPTHSCLKRTKDAPSALFFGCIGSLLLRVGFL